MAHRHLTCQFSKLIILRFSPTLLLRIARHSVNFFLTMSLKRAVLLKISPCMNKEGSPSVFTASSIEAASQKGILFSCVE